tara:strand:- start:1640 stop:1993 length:354 start_codon:yes stop_codon:yes gene_type:complete
MAGHNLKPVFLRVVDQCKSGTVPVTAGYSQTGRSRDVLHANRLNRNDPDRLTGRNFDRCYILFAAQGPAIHQFALRSKPERAELTMVSTAAYATQGFKTEFHSQNCLHVAVLQIIFQ